MEKEKKLKNLNIVYFESRHSKTLGDLIALQGGTAYAAPAMKEVPLENNAEVFCFAEKFFLGKISSLILLTGVGAKALVTVLETRYPREKIFEQLKKITIVPRGPKPVRVLNEWGIPCALKVPEPNTWRELLKAIDEHPDIVPMHGKTIALQEYGVSNPELLSGLSQRGAEVMRVPVYRWALPDDLEPLKKAILKILAGEIHVAMFTTAVQADHLFQVASQMGVKDKLKKAFEKLVVASVGPDCSETLRGYGLSVDIEPADPKMGPLVKAVAEKAPQVWKAKCR